MTTLTVNIDNKQSEKVLTAVLDALGLSYNIKGSSDSSKRPLNKAEQHIYDDLKASLQEIQLHQQGKIELRDAKESLNEL